MSLTDGSDDFDYLEPIVSTNQNEFEIVKSSIWAEAEQMFKMMDKGPLDNFDETSMEYDEEMEFKQYSVGNNEKVAKFPEQHRLNNFDDTGMEYDGEMQFKKYGVGNNEKVAKFPEQHNPDNFDETGMEYDGEMKFKKYGVGNNEKVAKFPEQHRPNNFDDTGMEYDGEMEFKKYGVGNNEKVAKFPEKKEYDRKMTGGKSMSFVEKNLGVKKKTKGVEFAEFSEKNYFTKNSDDVNIQTDHKKTSKMSKQNSKKEKNKKKSKKKKKRIKEGRYFDDTPWRQTVNEISMQGVRTKLVTCIFDSKYGPIGIKFKKFEYGYYVTNIKKNSQAGKLKLIHRGMLIYEILSDGNRICVPSNKNDAASSALLIKKLISRLKPGIPITFKFIVVSSDLLKRSKGNIPQRVIVKPDIRHPIMKWFSN